MAEIYSFDIFDTLLLRPYADPQEVWRVLEEEENAQGFAKDRKKADALTYKRAKRRGGETSIEEAYDLIPQWRHLMHKEMELERRVLRANPETLTLWNKMKQEGKNLIIISDMYLPSDFLQSLLKEKGITGWSNFYLSRDYDARKVTGELYKIVLQNEGIKPEDLHHVGDNMISDVKIPQSLGIRAQYYKKIINRLYDYFPFAKHIDGRLSGIMALGFHLYRLQNPDNTYWNRIGYMMGGALGYMYVKWIVNTAKSLDKDHLLFVARDGYIWKKICNALYPEIRTDYFYAPRLTSIAVLGAIGSHPYAIKERREYLLHELKDVDLKKIKETYSLYAHHLDISDKSAIIDGCSSGFSAQRLVETCIGHDVYGLYLLAMAKKDNVSALYSTNLYGLQFQDFSEFLFGSPEAPIIGVNVNGPIYSSNPGKQEELKMSLSSQIADASVACAKFLHDENYDFSASVWLNYIDTFMAHLTKNDKKLLGSIKNAKDLKQKGFKSVIYKPHKKIDFVLKRAHNIPNRIDIYILNHLFSIGVGKHGEFFSHRITDIIIDNKKGANTNINHVKV